MALATEYIPVIIAPGIMIDIVGIESIFNSAYSIDITGINIMNPISARIHI